MANPHPHIFTAAERAKGHQARRGKPAGHVFTAEESARAHAARRKLSPEVDKQILREKQNMSLKALAEKYSVEPSTIQCAIKRAKKFMQC